ncbi:hypothetical protein BY996DRAFT_6413849 [Phakopsora pachyrhizi]|nr:hypothetical protein BY996DRAFT_6413849 [Phakopsora pachyrhizi]
MPPKISARGRYPLRVSLRARKIPPSPVDNSKAGQKPRKKTSPDTQGVTREVSSGYRTTEGSSATGEEKTNFSLQMELEQASSKEAQRHLPPTPYTKTIPGFLPDTTNPGTELQGYSPYKDISIGYKKHGRTSQSVQSHSIAKAGTVKKDSPVRESVNTEYTKKQAGSPNVQSRQSAEEVSSRGKKEQSSPGNQSLKRKTQDSDQNRESKSPQWKGKGMFSKSPNPQKGRNPTDTKFQPQGGSPSFPQMNTLYTPSISSWSSGNPVINQAKNSILYSLN